MEIKRGNFVKTYNLCTGEIAINKIDYILDEDIEIVAWMGCREFRYADGRRIQFPNRTLIWDKRNKRCVFKHIDDGCACFSTIVLDACSEESAPYRLFTEGEKATYLFHGEAINTECHKLKTFIDKF